MTKSAFAATVLSRLGIPDSQGARDAFVGWMNAEGGHWNNLAKHNPLNTTLNKPGAGNTGRQGNIKVYPDWATGIQATVDTLRDSRYAGIRKALAAGNPGAVAAAIDASPWGTHGPALQAVARGKAGNDAPVAAAARRASTMTTGSPGTVSLPGSAPDPARAVGMANLEASNASPLHGLPKLGMGADPLARAQQLLATGQANSATSSTLTGVKNPKPVVATGGSNPGPTGSRHIFELIHKSGGGGGFAVKDGRIVSGPQVYGAVWNNHGNHVHVAADPNTLAHLGRLAQRMGLQVGENVYFTGTQPAGGHVSDSYHYRQAKTAGGKPIDLAFDASGDPRAMNQFAAEVEKMAH